MDEWKDNSYGEPEEPTCWKLSIPVLYFKPIEVKVHRRHDNLKVWHLSCISILMEPKQLKAFKIEEAKREALQHLHMVIGQMATSIGYVAMNISTVSRRLVGSEPNVQTIPREKINTAPNDDELEYRVVSSHFDGDDAGCTFHDTPSDGLPVERRPLRSADEPATITTAPGEDDS